MQRFRDFSMKLGTSGLTRLGLSILFFLVTFLLTVRVVAAQEAASATGVQPQSAQPAQVPAAQPVPQATQNPAAPAAAPLKADDATKPPESMQVKLGAGDLIEVSVYNVPELASKV